MNSDLRNAVTLSGSIKTALATKAALPTKTTLLAYPGSQGPWAVATPPWGRWLIPAISLVPTPGNKMLFIARQNL